MDNCIYFNFINLYPENGTLFLVENLEDEIYFQWGNPPLECVHEGNYRLNIFDNQFNSIASFITLNDTSTYVSYENLQIQNSNINSYNWNVVAMGTDFESEYLICNLFRYLMVGFKIFISIY